MKGNNGYREAVPEQFSIARKILQQKEEAMIADYYWCRAHHRQMWSTIARLDDEVILRCNFRISYIKEMVAYYLGFEVASFYKYSLCYACFWAKSYVGSGCNACPIKQNLDDDCSHNAYEHLRRLSGAYSSLECSERTIYWKGYLERFRKLALEMANAW